jgi:twitching motility protein PilT
LARLDPLLQALVDRNAEELVLAQGCRPAFRFGEEMQPVSKQELSEGQITALLSELSDQIQPGAAISPTGRFNYLFADGRSFVCQIDNGGAGFRATLRRDTEVAAEPADAGPAALATEPPPRVQEQSPDAAAAIVTPRPGEPEINALLRQMVSLGASDLHLSADETPMVRVDGDMTRLDGITTMSPDKTRDLLQAILPEKNLEEYERTNDSDFAHEIEGVARFRVNVFRDRKGTGAVFRTIPTKVLTAKDLNLPAATLDLCQLTKGLVLVTGPTGSGKSTTLAAMVDHINRQRCDHIITIEDPIEFVHQNQKCLVNQREVHNHTDGFKRALRAALREDPDIVLVGEMRDLETIAIAIETAETGHLVFGTLHTTSACSTVDRIIDQFPADRQAQIRMMLSGSLRGVISQTLLKRTGGGRIAALEILIVTAAISNLIREGKTFQIPSLMQTGKKRGMQMMNDALLELIRKKLIDPEEAYRKAIDKTSFVSQLRSAGIQLKAAPEA